MTYPKPKDGTGLHTILVDLDGTLAEPTWPSPKIGKPIQKAVDAAIEARNDGWEMVIFTARPLSHFETIVDWLKEHGLSDVFYDIICNKPRAAAMWDDRAVTFPEAFTEPRPRFPTKYMHDPRAMPGTVHPLSPACARYNCVEVP